LDNKLETTILFDTKMFISKRNLYHVKKIGFCKFKNKHKNNLVNLLILLLYCVIIIN